MSQSYSVCEHCHRQVTPGHSCPQDPDRLRNEAAINNAARAGHEAGAAAADTVADTLMEPPRRKVVYIHHDRVNGVTHSTEFIPGDQTDEAGDDAA